MARVKARFTYICAVEYSNAFYTGTIACRCAELSCRKAWWLLYLTQQQSAQTNFNKNPNVLIDCCTSSQKSTPAITIIKIYKLRDIHRIFHTTLCPSNCFRAIQKPKLTWDYNVNSDSCASYIIWWTNFFSGKRPNFSTEEWLPAHSNLRHDGFYMETLHTALEMSKTRSERTKQCENRNK